MRRYFSRIADGVLESKLRSTGAVLIRGPKWCGKSTTAAQVAQSAVYLQDLAMRDQNIALAKNAPGLFLEGATPRLIDEWQDVAFIWDQVRYEVDRRGENGQFILTGSATPLSDDGEAPYKHSGIGRITPMTMYPMTLFESGDGEGSVSLKALFDGEGVEPTKCDAGLLDYAYFVCRGGWPRVVELGKNEALEQAYVFYEGLVNDDINRVFKTTKNPMRIRRFMRSYARATASETSIAEIKRDMRANEGEAFDDATITSYANALERLYVVDDLLAWNPNLRSKTAIRTSSTRHFSDPSIGCAALGLGPDDLIGDLRTFGLFFESMCVRDLRVYADSLKGQVYHYRDARGREVDAVVHLRDGRWAAIEVKLASQDAINEAAKHLLALAADIDASKMKPPSFLMVLTATEYAYRREDGVYVVPIGCLKD